MVTVVSKNAADKLSNAGDNDEGKKIHELIFNYVSENKFEELKNLLSEHTIPVDILDEDGTTPLLHACYKGNKNIVEFLIEKVILIPVRRLSNLFALLFSSYSL